MSVRMRSVSSPTVPSDRHPSAHAVHTCAQARHSSIHAGRPWTARATRNLTATLERLRVDRQLEEALTRGADPLHLALGFGIDEKTAIRYADSARALLEEAAEQASL